MATGNLTNKEFLKFVCLSVLIFVVSSHWWNHCKPLNSASTSFDCTKQVFWSATLYSNVSCVCQDTKCHRRTFSVIINGKLENWRSHFMEAFRCLSTSVFIAVVS